MALLLQILVCLTENLLLLVEFLAFVLGIFELSQVLLEISLKLFDLLISIRGLFSGLLELFVVELLFSLVLDLFLLELFNDMLLLLGLLLLFDEVAIVLDDLLVKSGLGELEVIDLGFL